MKPELSPSDADALDTLNFILRVALGVFALCVVGIAHLEGLL
ncbi:MULTISPECIES: hypothetical protein [unclassified Caballeronia]|nr:MULTISPECIES: hypothetical protein [unclassified Caballeronia]MDR5772110.1 hypothetical protein [Caballeronia sp. LZ002]MDR5847544.1 hypothetical protein [Caballeronia sp. LZ003]